MGYSIRVRLFALQKPASFLLGKWSHHKEVNLDGLDNIYAYEAMLKEGKNLHSEVQRFIGEVSGVGQAK